MTKIQIVSKFRINGKLYSKEELDAEELKSMVAARINEEMQNIGFEKEKTAQAGTIGQAERRKYDERT